MSDQKERTIKQLPPQERPYEKCLKLGCRALSDAELLAVIIRTGSVGDTSVELARRVLSMAGAEQNIQELQDCRYRSLPGSVESEP